MGTRFVDAAFGPNSRSVPDTKQHKLQSQIAIRRQTAAYWGCFFPQKENAKAIAIGSDFPPQGKIARISVGGEGGGKDTFGARIIAAIFRYLRQNIAIAAEKTRHWVHSTTRDCSVLVRNSEEFQKPQPLLVSEKVLQYTSNLYGSMPPICIAVPSWLLSLEERETQQYTSHLYCSTPPICTAVLLRKYWGLGSPESSR